MDSVLELVNKIKYYKLGKLHSTTIDEVILAFNNLVECNLSKDIVTLLEEIPFDEVAVHISNMGHERNKDVEHIINGVKKQRLRSIFKDTF